MSAAGFPSGPVLMAVMSTSESRVDLNPAWNCGSVEEVDQVMDFAISKGASLLKPAHKTDYGGYSGYFGDPDNHPWEVVVAPGIEVGDDRRVHMPD